MDENGDEVILLMFDCPFFYRLPVSRLSSDDEVQSHLNEWRSKEGDSWLDNLGPILKSREQKNMTKAVGQQESTFQ